MTANPDSALRQALVAARKIITALMKSYRVNKADSDFSMLGSHGISVGDCRKAHALITEALQRGEK